MNESPRVSDSSQALDELLEAHVRELSEKLSRPCSIEEIQEQLSALNDLVYTFKRKDEMVEKLLDGATPEEKRNQIREALRAQHIRVAENRADAERLHTKSVDLLQRAMLLISRGQRQIDKTAHKHAGYALEPCGLCKGLGGGAISPCKVCNGRGAVLVHQPAVRCPHCSGSGKHKDVGLIYSSNVCVVCRGTGWAMTMPQ